MNSLKNLCMEFTRPNLLERDKNNIFDIESFKAFVNKGLFDRSLSDGSQLGDFGHYLREIVRYGGDIPLGLTCVAHAIGIDSFEIFGKKDWNRFHLKNIKRAPGIFAICNSEVTGGTDLSMMSSSIKVNEDGERCLHVEKYCISNLPAAQWVLVSLVDKSLVKPKLKVVAIKVEKKDMFSMIEQLEGFRTGLTGGLNLQSLSVESQNVIEFSESGSVMLKRMFNLERLLIPQLFVGMIEGLIDDSIAFSEEKVTFGKPVIENQFIQEKIYLLRKILFELKSGTDRLIPRVNSNDLETDAELSIFKESSVTKSIEAIQIYSEIIGHRGYLSNSLVSKYLRDVRAFAYLGGTKELHKIKAIASMRRRHSDGKTSREQKPQRKSA